MLTVLHYRHGWWHEHLGCEELGVSLEGPEDQMSCGVPPPSQLLGKDRGWGG